ncbi:histidine phosphatase family protein [Streptomyces sp. NPDC005017]|uniref:histidine phosphatase family protein n=1 Tax=Streptomyces sp. NPDC005017 TaxID=3364706 RepID=UPI0036974A0C
MTIRLTLLCAAAPAGREVRFADSPPDEGALRHARATVVHPSAPGLRLCAPSLRCRRTVEAFGWEAVAVEPALRDMEMGHWLGRTPEEVASADPAGFGAWLGDPSAAPHGGESVADVCGRVAAWLDGLPSGAGRVVAVVEQAVARAAVVHALAAPPGSFWRVDVPPLGAVLLTGRAGRWNLRLDGAVAGPPSGGEDGG